jgi:predicted DNA-binding transcriptional regulator AlpA
MEVSMTDQAENYSRLLTETEAAAKLGLEPTTLRRWRWSGDGPVFRKLGSAVRYHPEDLQAFIEAAARRSTSDVRAVAK